MQALTVVPTSGHAAVVRHDASGASPEFDFRQLMQLGETLVASGFMPRHIKTPAAAVAIILAGREMGIGPMLAIRSLQLVEGKVVVAADLQLARFKADGGRAQFLELTEERAVLALRHPNGDEHTETFTLADAKAAGLLGKDNWRKWPKAMLRSRVITAGLKSIGYEPTAGAYDPDEASAFMPAVAAESPARDDARSERPPYVTEDGEDRTPLEGDELLAWAAALPLRGKAGGWGGNAKKPIGDVDAKVLEAARDFFREKQKEEPAEWREDQIRAIEAVLADRAKEQLGMELDPAQEVQAPADAPTVQGGKVPPPGRVEDALEPNDKQTAPASKTDPESVHALTQRINALLADGDIAEITRKQVKAEIRKRPMNHDVLKRALAQLERAKRLADRGLTSGDDSTDLPF